MGRRTDKVRSCSASDECAKLVPSRSEIYKWREAATSRPGKRKRDTILPTMVFLIYIFL